MNKQVKPRQSRRVCDYFVVCGCGEELELTPDEHQLASLPALSSPSASHKLDDVLQLAFEPRIVDQYPLADHADFLLPAGIPLFCFPAGCQILTYKREPAFFSFVITSENGLRALGCCLVFYEKMSKSQRRSMISTLEENSIATTAFRSDVLPEEDAADDNNNSNNSSNNGNSSSVGVKGGHGDGAAFVAKKKLDLYAPKCLCVISNWPFVVAFKQYLCHIYRLFMSSSGIYSRYQVQSQGQSSSPKSGAARFYYKYGISVPIERYICNFVDNVPSPPFGRVDVVYILENSTGNGVPNSSNSQSDSSSENSNSTAKHTMFAEEIIGAKENSSVLFRCPRVNEPNAWSDSIPMHHLFECLDPANVALVFTCILIEKQVIFISSQYSLLTYCSEALMSLLYPITWAHAYFPILPFQLIGALEAPYPFIAGIHSSFLCSKKTVIHKDAVRVYLDYNAVVVGDSTTVGSGRGKDSPDLNINRHIGEDGVYFDAEVPKLPEKRGKKLHAGIVSNIPALDYSQRKSINFSVYINLLQKRLHSHSSSTNSHAANSNSIGDDWQTNRLPYFDDAFNSSADLPLSPGQFAGGSDPINVTGPSFNEKEIRNSFLGFFVAVLKDYRKYLNYGSTSLFNFRTEDFLQQQPADWQPFLKLLLSTQLFSCFIDERTFSTNSSSASGKTGGNSYYMSLYSSSGSNRDILFFDESIDAKINRYSINKLTNYYYNYSNGNNSNPTPASTAQQGYGSGDVGASGRIDTPFLSNNLHMYVKTYVAPGITTENINLLGVVQSAESTEISESAEATESAESSVIVVDPTVLAQTHIVDLVPSKVAIDNERQEEVKTYIIDETITVFARCPLNYMGEPQISRTVYTIKYNRFPKFNKGFFVAPRILPVSFNNSPGLTLQFIRLKRANVVGPTLGSEGSVSEKFSGSSSPMPSSYLNSSLFGGKNDKNDNADDIFLNSSNLMSTCTISTYVIALCTYVCDVMNVEVQSAVRQSMSSNIQLIEGLNSKASAMKQRGSGSGGSPGSGNRRNSISIFEKTAEMEAAKIGIKVIYEAINCLTKMGQSPDEIVYRCVIDTCGVCGDFIRAIDMLLYMTEEGYIPDRLILYSLSRAYAVSLNSEEARIDNANGRSPGFNRLITYSDIWGVTDWKSLRLSNESTLLFPSQVKRPSAAAGSASTKIVDFLFRPTNTNGSSNNNAGYITPTSTPTKSAPPAGFNDNSFESAQSPVSTKSSGQAKQWWHPNYPSEGLIPQLQWSGLSVNPRVIPVFAASSALHRQMRHCENKLIQMFPDLCIDLQHPWGMKCPNTKCHLGRCLTLSETFQSMPFGDHNRYTTVCPSCKTSFVPRFLVTYTDRKSGDVTKDIDLESKPDASTVDILRPTEVWCELLNPWTFRKEMFSMLFTEDVAQLGGKSGMSSGVSLLVSKDFHAGSYQHSVLFWNAVIIFRLRGLPFSFLLTDGDIIETFPPPEKSNPK